MKRTGFPRAVLTALAAAILLTNLVVLAPPAAAQVTAANGALGLVRVISAINRRNRVYQAARDTQRDFNAHYNALRDTARAQLVSGELQGLRRGEAGLEPARAAAYIRLSAALAQEQAAVTRTIDAETNEARRDFNRALVRQLQEVVIRLPGAQQILGDVRTVISNMRATVIALQAAAAANQPLDVLTQRLAEQVSSSSIIQDSVRELGSALGPDLDQALGGALTQVNNTLQDVNREANQAVELLDGMDGQVAALDLSQAEVAEGEPTGGPLNIRLTDRATAVLDVASQAIAFLSAMEDVGGTTREQLYQQIRGDLLQERNAALLQAAQTVRLITCSGVGRGEYEMLMGMLGKPPGTASDPENAKYVVCIDRETGQPVRAFIVGGVSEAAATPGEGTPSGEPVAEAGTYVGQAEFPRLGVGSEDALTYEKTVTVNEVRLTVLEDGQAEGQMSYEARETYIGKDCTTHFDHLVSGLLNGRLVTTGASLTLNASSKVNWTPYRLNQFDCGEPGSSSGSYIWSGPVSVDGGHIHAELTATDDEGGSQTFVIDAYRE